MVQQSDKLELVINLKTARVLGVHVGQSVAAGVPRPSQGGSISPAHGEVLGHRGTACEYSHRQRSASQSSGSLDT